MAVVDENDDQDQQSGGSGQSQSGSSSAPVQVASAGTSGDGSTGQGSSAAPSSSSAQPAGTSGGTQNTNSGSFTNLKSYLGANNNYNSGQGFGNQVNSNLSGQAQNINNNINNASNTFQTQTVNSTQPVTSQYNNFENSTGNGSNLNDIYNYAQNSQNVANTQGLEGASYSGPQTLNDLSGANNGSTIQNNIGNYNGLVQGAGTQAGTSNLLNSLYGQQGYNQGDNTLDSAFLSGNNFSGAQAAGNSLTNSYNQANANAQNSAQNVANTINGYAQNVTGQLNNATTGLGQAIQNQYATNIAGQAGQVAAQQAALTSGNISATEANALGLTNGENFYNTLSNGNVGNYVSANTGYNTQDAATQDQYNQVAALNNLLGTNANTTSAGVLSNYSGGMPTGNSGLINYNGTQLGSDITNAQNSYQGQAGNDLNLYNEGLQGLDASGGAIFGYGNRTPIQYTPETLSALQGIVNNGGGNSANMFGEGGADQGQVNAALGQTAMGGSMGSNDFDQQLIAMGALQNLMNQYGANNTFNVGS